MLIVLDINHEAKTVTAEQPANAQAMVMADSLERLLDGRYSLCFQPADVKSPYARSDNAHNSLGAA